MASQLHHNGGSATAVVEMEPVYLSPLHAHKSASTPPDSSSRRASSDEERQDGEPTTAAEVKQRWNHPRTNIRRVGACFYSFIVMGANDAAYGVSLGFLLDPGIFIILGLKDD